MIGRPGPGLTEAFNISFHFGVQFSKQKETLKFRTMIRQNERPISCSMGLDFPSEFFRYLSFPIHFVL